MKILLCNDDGLDEPGLRLLEAAAGHLSGDVWVVAPDGKRTANAHALTCGVPYDLIKHDDRRFSCTGSPADCVVAAMTHVFSGGPLPDLVLGGVNFGRNVAEDAAYSGTLGIAREAAFWGIPSLGLSRPKTAQWAPDDEHHLADLLRAVLALKSRWHGEGFFLGINLPDLLPARAQTARPGRDKIAFRSEVVGIDGNRTTLVVPRGRQHKTQNGDESSVLSTGDICVMRYDAYSQAALPAGFADALSGGMAANFAGR